MTGTALALHRQLAAVWGAGPGWRGWLGAVNHGVVGRRFMLVAALFFLVGGVLGLLIRAQLAGPDTHFLNAPAYAQVFTMHGTVMMFLFAIPMIEGFTLWILPKILGARDLAFPRLSAFGFWCYVFGGLILLTALLAGVAPDTGWFMYTPLASRPYSPGINADVWLIGVTFVEVSAVAFAIEVVVTVLKVRAQGMALMKMPLLAWYLWITAAMMLVGFPPLIMGSVLLEVERALGLPFFDPARGGDPLLWQHLFWMFGHPEVYIIFFPAAGIISTLIAAYAGRPIIGYGWIVGALIAQAFLSFGLWVHHMFATGLPHLSLTLFSAASLLVVLPTAVQIVAWIATLWAGRPRLTLPMWYIFGFLFIFVTGGLTGVMVALIPFNLQVHDTHFVVAHLHYVLVGGFVFPVIAGLYHWLPLASGRTAERGLGLFGFWLLFLGFNLTFMVMHLTGLLGMPRRVYTYAPGLGWDIPNLVSSMGAFVMGIGFAAVLVDLLLQWRWGPHAPRTAISAPTLEWALPRRPPPYNLASLPAVTGREPLWDNPRLPLALARGQGLLAGAPRGAMETLGVSVDGRAEQVLLLPGPSLAPILAAGALGIFFLSILAGLYWLTALGAVATIVCVWRWMWQTGARQDPPLVEAAPGLLLAPSSAHPDAPARLALWGWFVVDATFLASLAFGTLFLRITTPAWAPPAIALPPLEGAAAILVAALAAALLASLARHRVERGGSAAGPLLGAAVASGAATAGLVALLLSVPRPDLHAHPATLVALAGFAALHMGLATIASAYAHARARGGFVSARRRIDVANTAELQWWTLLVVAACVLLFWWPVG